MNYFSSWTYSGRLMDIFNSTSQGDLLYFTPNGEWDLIGMPVIRHEVRTTVMHDIIRRFPIELAIATQNVFF